MTPPEREAALARCDRELARIKHEGKKAKRDKLPAWLLALGKFDWEAEKRAIEREDAK